MQRRGFGGMQRRRQCWEQEEARRRGCYDCCCWDDGDSTSGSASPPRLYGGSSSSSSNSPAARGQSGRLCNSGYGGHPNGGLRSTARLLDSGCGRLGSAPRSDGSGRRASSSRPRGAGEDPLKATHGFLCGGGGGAAEWSAGASRRADLAARCGRAEWFKSVTVAISSSTLSG